MEEYFIIFFFYALQKTSGLYEDMQTLLLQKDLARQTYS